MFVMTVDQVDSRSRPDLVAAAIAAPTEWADGVVLGPDRTAGDEFQAVFDAPAAALRSTLALLRTGDWSVGLGIGAVTTPLPASTREATGTAFVAARAAVAAAKRAPHRFALETETAPEAAQHAQALIELLLELRSRRSSEGWAATDLLAAGASQVAVAATLAISPQAVSLRLRAAGTRLEQRAVPALVEVLARLNADVAGRP